MFVDSINGWMDGWMDGWMGELYDFVFVWDTQPRNIYLYLLWIRINIHGRETKFKISSVPKTCTEFEEIKYIQ